MFNDFIAIRGNESEEKKMPSTSRVLVVSFFGKAFAILVEDSVALEFIKEGGGFDVEGFSLEGASIDYGPLPDGVHIGILKLEDDGPGDWPGSREACVALRDVRPATKEEWEAHLAGDWPWATGEVGTEEGKP
jgi:hypothetical protein